LGGGSGLRPTIPIGFTYSTKSKKERIKMIITSSQMQVKSAKIFL